MSSSPKAHKKALLRILPLVGAAEAVVAVGDLADVEGLGGAGPELEDVG